MFIQILLGWFGSVLLNMLVKKHARFGGCSSLFSNMIVLPSIHEVFFNLTDYQLDIMAFCRIDLKQKLVLTVT